LLNPADGALSTTGAAQLRRPSQGALVTAAFRGDTSA
jgi:hypothetical protein